MTKKRTYQQRKERREKITSCIIYVLCFLFCGIYLISGIRQITVVDNISSRNTKIYSGTYSMYQYHRLRHPVYLFDLGNGDKLFVDKLSDYQLINGQPLTFQYAGPKNGHYYNHYTGVEIRSQDDVFLSQPEALRQAKVRRSNYFFSAALCFIIPFLPHFCGWLLLKAIPSICDLIAERRKKKNK